MRTAFIQELIAQARIHPDIFLVVGDLGFSVVEPFVQEFPGRYLNAGVAEQNMTGVAAGLASEGYHVFTYSIANFPTLRCLEQLRNDLAQSRPGKPFLDTAVQCLDGFDDLVRFKPAEIGGSRLHKSRAA